MSSVTSVIIWGLYADKNIGEINRWLSKTNHNHIKELDCCDCGGEKCMSPAILVGGFNYLGDFAEFLKSLKWKSETVVIIWHEQRGFPKIIRLGI